MSSACWYAQPCLRIQNLLKVIDSTSGHGRSRIVSSLAQSIRSYTRDTFDSLVAPVRYLNYAPHLVEDLHRKKGVAVRGAAEVYRAYPNDTWDAECRHRFLSTGLVVRDIGIRRAIKDGTIVDPDHEVWGSVRILRIACRDPFLSHRPVEWQIAARKLCASTQDRRYPKIYRSLETQAHALYLIGRVELERQPVWRPLAWYILMISAGLGHLDAALLLHQLNKIDSANTLSGEQRNVIARAAETRLDWRAIVAHCEYEIRRLKQRRKGERMDESELEPCLRMLFEASRMTKPTSGPKGVTEQLPEGCLDVNQLENFQPPYRSILDLTARGALDMTASQQFQEHFRSAALIGVEDYNDPGAAWLYAQWETVREEPYSQNWLRCTRLAADAANADACFQLARYSLTQDGWYPSLTARVLSEIQQREMEEMRQHHNPTDVRTKTEVEIHQEIMSRKDPKMMQLTKGLSWMKISAELELDSPVKIVNRYCIIAGLLRQNGFLMEGRAAMEEAWQSLQSSTGDVNTKDIASRKVKEFLQNWDERQVHRLLTIEQVGQLLGPPLNISP